MKTSRAFSLLPVILLTSINSNGIPVADDFNDGIKDLSKWGTDFGTTGALNEQYGEIGYILQNADVEGSKTRPWIQNTLPYDSDWEVELDVFLSFTSYYDNMYGAFGLYLWKTGNTYPNMELAGVKDKTNNVGGFEATMRIDEVTTFYNPQPFTHAKGVLHIEFNHITKVISMKVGTESSPVINWNPFVPDTWNSFGSYGISAAGGGSIANSNWEMGEVDSFSIGIFANVKLSGDTFIGSGELFRMAVYSADLWIDSVDLGNGWKSLDWFGIFNPSTVSEPWIIHETHGWLKPSGRDTGSIWFFDPVMGTWWWTSESVYPMIYRPLDGAWLAYQMGTLLPRRFYNISTGLTEEW